MTNDSLFRPSEVIRLLGPWGARILGCRSKSSRVKVQDGWVEVPLGDDWITAYRLILQDGEPVVGEVRVFPKDNVRGRPPGLWSAEIIGFKATAPRGGLPAEVLRQVQLGAYRRHGQDFLDWLHETKPSRPITAAPTGVGGPGAAKGAKPRPGKPDEFYADIAKDYVDLWTTGTPHPISQIAIRRSTSKSKVRDMVREARQRGLLTPGQRGRIGGQLTARALELLRHSGRHSAVRSTRKK